MSRRTDPTPEEARRRAREASPGILERAKPPADDSHTNDVRRDCDGFDPRVVRLWVRR